MNKFFRNFALPLTIGALLAIIVIQNFPQFFQGKNDGKVQIGLNTENTQNTQNTQNSKNRLALSNQSGQDIQNSAMTSYYPAVKVAAPAVVNIYTTKVVEQNLSPFFRDPFFSDFFGNQNLFGRERLESSLGSGVILTEDGIVVTNEHVIKNAKEIKIALQDGREVFAKFIGSDSQTDIGILKIDLKNLPAIKLADSENLHIGDQVLAIGNPFGIGQTVTQGIISALGRQGLGNNMFEEFIQTDAAINPGNSGGALVNTKGELIGINTMIYSKSGGYQGIGFAIPSLLVKKVTQDIVTKGTVVRGWIGVELNPINAYTAEVLKVKAEQGLLITAIWRKSPAQKAGILPGDILLELNGKKTQNIEKVYHLIDDAEIGSQLNLLVLRKGEKKLIKVKVVQKPKNLNN